MSDSTMRDVPRIDHDREFRRAWDDPGNTRFEMPAVDVNSVLADRYRTGEPLTFTRAMLWDAEVRKAWRPDRYIPSVVREGSARTWGGRPGADGADHFLRASEQRLWREPGEFALVLERGRLDFSRQRATYIGAVELPGPDGTLRAGSGQPLFHVEHSVGGHEARPLNRWRIVHLTDGPDGGVLDRLEGLAENPWLPEFVEIYLRDDLGVQLSRRGVS